MTRQATGFLRSGTPWRPVPNHEILRSSISFGCPRSTSCWRIFEGRTRTNKGGSDKTSHGIHGQGALPEKSSDSSLRCTRSDALLSLHTAAGTTSGTSSSCCMRLQARASVRVGGDRNGTNVEPGGVVRESRRRSTRCEGLHAACSGTWPQSDPTSNGLTTGDARAALRITPSAHPIGGPASKKPL